MSYRTTISLESETHAFLNEMGGQNKSAYINLLLKQEKQRTLVQSVAQANAEEAEDMAYQDELSDWDIVLADGLSNDD